MATDRTTVFYVRGRGVKAIKTFRIFNRWGQLVFERVNCNVDDASCAWDGKFNWTTAQPGRIRIHGRDGLR